MEHLAHTTDRQERQDRPQTETFTLRANQMYTADAVKLTLADMVKEQERSKNTLSKADIILICAVYGSLQEFYRVYRDYLSECVDNNFLYCQPPHYYLKYQIG